MKRRAAFLVHRVRAASSCFHELKGFRVGFLPSLKIGPYGQGLSGLRLSFLYALFGLYRVVHSATHASEVKGTLEPILASKIRENPHFLVSGYLKVL